MDGFEFPYSNAPTQGKPPPLPRLLHCVARRWPCQQSFAGRFLHVRWRWHHLNDEQAAARSLDGLAEVCHGILCPVRCNIIAPVLPSLQPCADGYRGVSTLGRSFRTYQTQMPDVHYPSWERLSPRSKIQVRIWCKLAGRFQPQGVPGCLAQGQ